MPVFQGIYQLNELATAPLNEGLFAANLFGNSQRLQIIANGWAWRRLAIQVAVTFVRACRPGWRRLGPGYDQSHHIVCRPLKFRVVGKIQTYPGNVGILKYRFYTLPVDKKAV